MRALWCLVKYCITEPAVGHRSATAIADPRPLGPGPARASCLPRIKDLCRGWLFSRDARLLIRSVNSRASAGRINCGLHRCLRGSVLAFFEAPIFAFCFSSRASSAFVSRPVVPDFGSATDALRGAAKADFGVSGWIEALSLGSAPEADEDGAILEFWALARQIKVAATVTNKKAILHFIVGNLQVGRSVPTELA